MLNYKDVDSIKTIREGLDKVGYDLLYQRVNGYLNYYVNPWSTYDEINYKLKRYDKKIQNLFKLLLLSEDVLYDDAIDIINPEFVKALLCVNIAVKREDRICGAGYSIISYFDRYFVVDTFPDYPNGKVEQFVYIGMDTYRLCSALPQKRTDKALDLCTGSGIQAIMRAPFTRKQVAVELNQEVIPVTKFNTIMNGYDNMIDVIESDLYTNLGDEKYDLITANPPFLPIPKDIYFPRVGDGGKDGLEIIRKILEGLNKYLSVNGECIIIGECLGDQNKPTLYHVLQEILPKGYVGQLYLQARNAKNQYIENISKLYKRQINESQDIVVLEDKLQAVFDNEKSDSYYMFTLKIVKGKDIEKQSEFFIVKNYSKWSDEVKPELLPDVQLVKNGVDYVVKKGAQVLGTVPIRIYECLKLCNGRNTIDEIVRLNCKGAYSKTRELFENTCEMFERTNCISI
ncbi:MAG: methyltransferase [Lachnotalea sp.]